MIFYRQGELHDGGVRQSMASPAFRYGVGLFETLLYNGSAICRLPQHLARAQRSMEYFGLTAEETDYAAAIAMVLEASGLERSPARVNIFFQVEDEEGGVCPVVTAAPYAADAARCYRLMLSSAPVVHPYFVHKSMSSMFHWMERRNARLLGYDDAVLVQQGNVLIETTTAALVFGDGTNFCTPNSMDKLESTALEGARELLHIHGCTIRSHSANTFRHAYVLNSLIGMRPVVALQGVPFEPDEETCRRVTALICS